MKDELSDSRSSNEEIDLGERKISKMNFSNLCTIPKIFIQSTPYEGVTSVRLLMGRGYLKLVPSRAKHGDQEVGLWRS